MDNLQAVIADPARQLAIRLSLQGLSASSLALLSTVYAAVLCRPSNIGVELSRNLGNTLVPKGSNLYISGQTCTGVPDLGVLI